jgi:hypothetical protein
LNSYRIHQTTIYKQQHKIRDYWFNIAFKGNVKSSLEAIKNYLGLPLYTTAKIISGNIVLSQSNLFDITIEIVSFERIVKCSYCGHKQKTRVSEPLNYQTHVSYCENCRKENWINTITWRVEN